VRCAGDGDEHWLEVQLAMESEMSHLKLFWNREYYSPVTKAGGNQMFHIFSHRVMNRCEVLPRFHHCFNGSTRCSVSLDWKVEVCHDSCQSVLAAVQSSDLQNFEKNEAQVHTATGHAKLCRYSIASPGCSAQWIQGNLPPNRCRV
jgi:hypothetical protein